MPADNKEIKMVVFYIFILICAFLFYVLYTGAASLLIFLFALIMFASVFIINLYSRKRISARISIKRRNCTAGQNIPINIEIRNDSKMPVFAARIAVSYKLSYMDEPSVIKISTPLFPGTSQILTTSFSSQHYGIVTLSIMKIRIYDMLHISTLSVPAGNIYSENSSVIILPDVLPLQNRISDYSDSGLDSDNYSADKPGDDPSEIFSLHEYSDGDKMSRIHWKLTAKQNELMVKDYSLPICDNILIITDTYLEQSDDRTRARIYDALISLTASLSERLCENNVRHQICVYNENQRSMNVHTVSDENSKAEALIAFVSSGICAVPCAALKLTAADSDTKKYAHVISVCSGSSDRLKETGGIFAGSEMGIRYTILHCTDDPCETMQSAGGIDTIPVRIGKIETSVSELIL